MEALREKCPNTEFFWSVFSRIWTEYRPEKTPYLDTFHEVRVKQIAIPHKCFCGVLTYT